MKKNVIVAMAIIICMVFFLILNETLHKPEQKKTMPVKKQIGFYHYYSGPLSGGIAEMVDEVNRGQTQFNVSAQALDHEAFKSMIHTMLDKGNPPEIFSYWAGARVQNLVDQNKLASIDDLWQNENFDKRFPKSVIDAACTYNGHKYLVPIDQFIVLFFYNKQLFDTHHLSPPASWEEFLSLCQTLEQKNIIPLALGSRERWPAQFWLDYLLLRTQGLDYRNKLMNGSAKYTDPQVKKVYHIWSDLLQKQYFNKNANDLDWAQATQLLCEQKAAMTLMGSWAIQLFENNEHCRGMEDNFDFFIFPIMKKDIPKIALGPIDGIVLSRNSQNHEFAKTTLSYFAGQKPQERLSLGSGAHAPSLDVPLSFYSPFKKRIFEEMKSAAAWAFNYDLATPPEIAEIGMNSFQELIAFPEQYEKILENVEAESRMVFDAVNNKKND